MPIKVYIWKFQGITEAWGHASMSLNDGTHISWWPSAGDERKALKGNAMKAPPAHCTTLDDDIRGEDGKPPDVTHYIPSGYINEEAIKTWWQSFSKEANWRALDQNCSTVVYLALYAGYALNFFPEVARFNYESTLVWTPNHVDQFVQRLIEAIASQAKETPSKQGSQGKQTPSKQRSQGKQTPSKQESQGKQTPSKQRNQGKQTPSK